MAGHAHELDLLAVARFVARHHRHVDAAAVIAGGREFLPVALADHLEEIAVLEGLQRLDVVDLLQADDVGMRVGDGERGELARVVGVRHRPALLEQPVFGLVLDLVERQRAILVELIAETGEIEPVHQVFDVEGGNSERHSSLYARAVLGNTSWAQYRAGRHVLLKERFCSCSVHPPKAIFYDLTGIPWAWGRRIRLSGDLKCFPNLSSLARSGVIALAAACLGSAPPRLLRRLVHPSCRLSPTAAP